MAWATASEEGIGCIAKTVNITFDAVAPCWRSPVVVRPPPAEHFVAVVDVVGMHSAADGNCRDAKTVAAPCWADRSAAD